MKKILCPTDFSKAATNAVGYAALIAQKTEAALMLLHVIHLPMLDTTETALVAGEVLGEQQRHAVNKMQALCRHLTEKYPDRKLEVNYQVKEALLTDTVEHLTQTEDYDMVVIGSTGGGNTLEEILLGSNTKAIAERVKCPVLTVPPRAYPADFKHIVYGSNYQEEDIAALKQVLAFARLFSASVEMVHVSSHASKEQATREINFQNRLRAALPEYNLNIHEIVHSQEVEGMKDYLTRSKADLLAVLKKRKSFFSDLFGQSFSEQLIYHSKLPLLITHG